MKRRTSNIRELLSLASFREIDCHRHGGAINFYQALPAQRSDHQERSEAMIDAICLELEPLGDTLTVVVNLQNAAARNGDEAETLSRNCQLQAGDRAFLQAKRQVDVLPPELRAQVQAQARDANDDAERRRKAEEAAKILERDTPELGAQRR